MSDPTFPPRESPALSGRWGRRANLSAVMLAGGALVAALAMATLAPLAYATPPDQTWHSGIYDDGDFDDVVLLAWNTVSSGAITAAVAFFTRIVSAVRPTSYTGPVSACIRCTSSRAPPAPLAIV